MTSGIYAYWDNVNSYYVYVGKDSHIDKKARHYDHSNRNRYDEQQINKVIQNNPERYEYRVIMEGNYNNWQLNKMEKLCIKSFKTFKYDYPDRNVFNFTAGGDGAVKNQFYIRLDLDEIKRLYLEEKMTIFQIAEVFDVSKDTVYRRLKECGIDTGGVRYDIDEDEIIRLYCDEKLSTTEIAEILNVPRASIYKRLKKHNIDVPYNRSLENTPNYRSDIDDVEVIRLYCDEKLSTIEIADIFNVSRSTISNRLKKNNITPHYNRSPQNNPAYRSDIDNEEIKRLYCDESLSLRKIAKIFNASPSTILNRLKSMGIKNKII